MTKKNDGIRGCINEEMRNCDGQGPGRCRTFCGSEECVPTDFPMLDDEGRASGDREGNRRSTVLTDIEQIRFWLDLDCHPGLTPPARAIRRMVDDRLVVAAPDLLSALTELLTRSENFHACNVKFADFEAAREAMNNARAAIAKATGERDGS